MEEQLFDIKDVRYWDAERRNVQVFSEDWLPRLADSLDRAAAEFDNASGVDGRIERFWRVDEHLFLLEYVWVKDYDYYLTYVTALPAKRSYRQFYRKCTPGRDYRGGNCFYC